MALNRTAASAVSCITCYAGGRRHTSRSTASESRRAAHDGRLGVLVAWASGAWDGPTPSVRVATGVPVHGDVVRDGAPEKPLGKGPRAVARRQTRACAGAPELVTPKSFAKKLGSPSRATSLALRITDESR